MQFSIINSYQLGFHTSNQCLNFENYMPKIRKNKKQKLIPKIKYTINSSNFFLETIYVHIYMSLVIDLDDASVNKRS
jgi:hypothetical protein